MTSGSDADRRSVEAAIGVAICSAVQAKSSKLIFIIIDKPFLWNSILAAGGVSFLVELLGSDVGEEAETAARNVLKLAARSVDHGDALVAAGAVPGLVKLLGSKRTEAKYAAGALANLTLWSDAHRCAVMEAGAVPGLVRLLDGELAEKAAWSISIDRTEECAAATLQNLIAG